MLNGKKIAAIIPARSSSKGLRDKNIRPLCGVPLLAHTARAARESGVFDAVILSTDSPKYAEIGREYGAEVPFLRSAETATDGASSWSVVAETLSKLETRYDIVALLQPGCFSKNAPRRSLGFPSSRTRSNGLTRYPKTSLRAAS